MILGDVNLNYSTESPWEWKNKNDTIKVCKDEV